MFRALAVLRVVVLVNTVGLNAWRWDDYVRPALGIVVLSLLVAWTGFVTWAYARPVRRGGPLLGADLLVAIAALGASPLVIGDGLVATVPGFWVMAPMMAWAIRWGWRGGLVAAASLSGVDLAIRDVITQTNYGNIFLLMLGGPIVGYVSESLQRMARERDAAERAAAAAAERARLARAVHDGVLQVLSLVQRRGAEAGGELAALGRMAGEQEVALRSLIRQQDSLRAPTEVRAADVAALLEGLEGVRPPVVSVATPGDPVVVAGPLATGLLAAVRACLDNVAEHVGEDEPAWVLLEDLGDRLVVSVRDEGPGIPEGRLEEAMAEGRLGVSESIRGRIRDLGGTAAVTTGSFGTEWEFTVPKHG